MLRCNLVPRTFTTFKMAARGKRSLKALDKAAKILQQSWNILSLTLWRLSPAIGSQICFNAIKLFKKRKKHFTQQNTARLLEYLAAFSRGFSARPPSEIGEGPGNEVGYGGHGYLNIFK